MVGTDFTERLQTPTRALTIKPEDCRKVVGEYNCSEPCTITEARNLEDF